MGRSTSPTPPGMRPAEDAVSLHSTPEDLYQDDDAPELDDSEELPPLYSERDETQRDHMLPAARPGNLLDHHYEEPEHGAKWYIHRALDSDPKFLEAHVNYWATTPPRPSVRIQGTHTQDVHNNGKKEKKTVVDFDVRVELTPYLYSDAARQASWHELRTVDNGEKAKRGTIFKHRAPGANQNIEVGGDAKPTVAEWCHLYCASQAGLKAFTFRRKMVGFDEELVKRKIDSLVRGTNYRGHLKITFPVKEDLVEVYSFCRTNKWRLTGWIQMLFIFTLLFIFSWPYLFFRTKRFEVVRSEWAFSRPKQNGGKEYVSVSEEQWYNLWGRAIKHAVLSKNQCWLDQQDLLAAQGGEPVIDSGNATVDSALGFLRAGVNAMNEVNRTLGWGGDC
jgi:hypothetical protein